MLSQRKLFAGALLVAIALLACALYFQYVQGLEPCPLCILQRLALMVLGVIALLALIHNPPALARRLYGLLMLLTATAGGAIAARQVWLQHLPPDQVPACGPGLDYMLEVFPLGEALAMVLRGSGECAEVTWRFLGLSMAGWMVLVFACYLLFSLLLLFAPQLFRRCSRRNRG
ncbi:MAG: disulfide bond formation protein B [Gammaproteobacteria bacterium]